jgi:hypothetical protein
VTRPVGPTDPDLRTRIAANPTDPAERSRLINEAVTLNMTDEIPPDWGIGVGQSPEEPDEKEEFNDYTFDTDPYPIGIVLWMDATVSIHNFTGGQVGEVIFNFNPDREWTDTGLYNLQEAIEWATSVADEWDEFLEMIGDRTQDTSNNLYCWKVVTTGPEGSPTITVGLNINGLVTLMFGDESPTQRHSFLTDEDATNASNDIGNIRSNLEEEL